MTDLFTKRGRTTCYIVILGASVVSTMVWAAASSAEEGCTTLRRDTEAFSDASASGNAETIKRLLDDRVIFFNEGGDRATKTEMVSGAQPPRAGVEINQTIVDFRCETFGDVGVTSFIDDQRARVAGLETDTKFRSVETWRRTGSDWLMIGSETIALYDDPKAVSLPRQILADYVGKFTDGAGLEFVFALNGDGITAALNGGSPTLQKAEIRDVFFTPGRARIRKVFERDASGKVVGFAYRREGHDMLFKRVQ